LRCDPYPARKNSIEGKRKRGGKKKGERGRGPGFLSHKGKIKRKKKNNADHFPVVLLKGGEKERGKKKGNPGLEGKGKREKKPKNIFVTTSMPTCKERGEKGKKRK